MKAMKEIKLKINDDQKNFTTCQGISNAVELVLMAASIGFEIKDLLSQRVKCTGDASKLGGLIDEIIILHGRVMASLHAANYILSGDNFDSAMIMLESIEIELERDKKFQ